MKRDAVTFLRKPLSNIVKFFVVLQIYLQTLKALKLFKK